MTLGALVADTLGIVLPPRYEIRLTTPDVADWVLALNWYAQICDSDVVSGVHAGELAKATLPAYRRLRELSHDADMPLSSDPSYMTVDQGERPVLGRDRRGRPRVSG